MSAKLRELLMKVSAVDATFGDQFAVSNWMKANGTALLDELDALRAELAAARDVLRENAKSLHIIARRHSADPGILLAAIRMDAAARAEGEK